MKLIKILFVIISIQACHDFTYDLILKNYESGKIELALSKLNILLKTDSLNSNALHLRGKVNIDLERWEFAERDLEKAILISPNEAETYCGLAYIKLVYRENNKAIELCNKALEIDYDNSSAYVNRSSAYLELGRNEEAFHDIKKAITLCESRDDKDALSHSYGNMSIYYSRKENYRMAEDFAKKAILSDKMNVEPHLNLSKALASQGKYEEAIQVIEEARELGLKHKFFDFYIGAILHLSGDKTTGCELMQSALRNSQKRDTFHLQQMISTIELLCKN